LKEHQLYKARISKLSYPNSHSHLSKSELEALMNPFWKSLCENKLLPLTTSYGFKIGDKKLKDKEIYKFDLKFVNDLKLQRKTTNISFILENLCLRLS
jgi:hypothetical protein